MNDSPKKSPLANKLHGFNVPSSLNKFEEFEKRQAKKKRRLALKLLSIALVLVPVVYLLANQVERVGPLTNVKPIDAVDSTSVDSTILTVEFNQDDNTSSVVSIGAEDLTIHKTGTQIPSQNIDRRLETRMPSPSVEHNEGFESAYSVSNFNLIPAHTKKTIPFRPHQSILPNLYPPLDLSDTSYLDDLFDSTDPSPTDSLNIEDNTTENISLKVDIPPTSNWTLRVSAGALISGQITKPTSSESESSQYVHYDFIDQLNQGQNKSVGYSFDVSLSYLGFKLMNLTTGFGIERYGNQGNYDFLLDSVPVYDIDNTIAGYLPAGVSGPERVTGEAQQSYTYLQIPIGLQKTIFSTPRWRVGFEPGLNLGLLLTNSGSVLDEHDLSQIRNINQDDLVKFNIGYSLGMTIENQRPSGSALGLSTTYTRFTTPLEKSLQYQTQNHGLGVTLYFKYPFNFIAK